MRLLKTAILCASALSPLPALAASEDADAEQRTIIVTGAQEEGFSATKTDTPVIETPQPITVIDDELFLAQGAISIGDTLNYVSGVTANPYGPDSRVDGAFVRGINALQFRDGMRDIYSFYASIRADPYNFDQVELVRGPASVLFGQGALGGIINLVSKRPEFEASGEVSLRYGSFDRKEALIDVTGPLGDTVAARIVARVRDADTQTDYVPDDRVMVSPSITFKPSPDTDITFIGLYQEDDSGSTSQFLPLVGTILPNPNGQLSNSLFVGKPGWDRYDGRLLQGTALFEHRFGDTAKLNLKARYIDSDLTYFTHYPNNYSNPTNPYLDADQRIIGLYVDGSIARMEVFSTDNNVQFNFNTGSNIEHTVLAGVDFSFNSVHKTGGFGFEAIDIYDIDYDALSDYGGGLPTPTYVSEDVDQDQLGIYVQNQMRFFDRVSIVLGARRDWTTAQSMGGASREDAATTFRAGIIAEIVEGVSPFFSYTESFEPIAGTASDGSAFIPKAGRQFEAGIKFHPADNILMTVTGYHIKESNRPVSDDSTTDPFDQIQIGSMTSKGVEFEGNVSLPGEFTVIANASYNEAEVDGTGHQLDNVPKFNASLWTTKGFALGNDTRLLLGGGVRHVGKQRSFGPAFPDGVLTPSYTLVDMLAEITYANWSFALNATNLFDKRHYSACLARGDCFVGSERNIMGTVSYRF
ncbi:TonB-dependent siderophore receptor [Sphingorhabdus sp. 109]|jgi:iron complex outermembrane receptor protein|uniref:TonB-dependent siderophore receptor n=1 Tax=Sphingorhabdus sp. 109 TaxID=2653173 RepID=UPI0012EF359F|nr:TonB-dependent siderophore receptor [Sphingorhabdus sp. 109]VWX56660.1 TonB-dependent siderophore receptor [Sphingorhabdus sp. 109]